MTDPQDWRQEGLCTQVGGDAWFPGKGDSFGAIRRLCLTCPVQQSCLDDALTHPQEEDDYGIRGGVGPKRRRELRAQRRESAA